MQSLLDPVSAGSRSTWEAPPGSSAASSLEPENSEPEEDHKQVLPASRQAQSDINAMTCNMLTVVLQQVEQAVSPPEASSYRKLPQLGSVCMKRHSNSSLMVSFSSRVPMSLRTSWLMVLACSMLYKQFEERHYQAVLAHVPSRGRQQGLPRSRKGTS